MYLSTYLPPGPYVPKYRNINSTYLPPCEDFGLRYVHISIYPSPIYLPTYLHTYIKQKRAADELGPKEARTIALLNRIWSTGADALESLKRGDLASQVRLG